MTDGHEKISLTPEELEDRLREATRVGIEAALQDLYHWLADRPATPESAEQPDEQHSQPPQSQEPLDAQE